MQAVEEDAEVRLVGCKEGFYEGEVKDVFQKDKVVFDRVNDGDFGRTIGEVSNLRQINLTEDDRRYSGCGHMRMVEGLTSGASMILYFWIVLVIS